MEILIVGLGNYPKRYTGTRHNIGYDNVVDMVTSAYILDIDVDPKFKKKGKSLIYSLTLKSQDVISSSRVSPPVKVIHFLLPQTLMNLSGEAVIEFVRNRNIETQNIIAITDDIDLDFGKIRIRPNGSPAGHKGIISISNHLGSQNFYRLKIGVGKPITDIPIPKFVLTKFTSSEAKDIANISSFITNNLPRMILNFGLTTKFVNNFHKEMILI